MTVGAALRAGLADAVSLAPGTLLVFVTRAAEAIAGVLLVGWFASGGSPPLAAGLVVVFVAAELLRQLALGASLAQGRMRLRGLIRGGLIGEGRDVVHRVLPFAVLDGAIAIFLRLWAWLALTAGFVAFFGSPAVFGPSLLLSLAISIPPILAIATRIWTQLAFARSINRNEAPAVSLFEAVRAFSVRAFLIWLATALIAAVCRGAVTGMAGSLANPWDHHAPVMLALVAQVIAAATAAFIPAVLEVARVHAYLAMDLEAGGELPQSSEPVPVAPIVRAV